jgi:hypothetical protein
VFESITDIHNPLIDYDCYNFFANNRDGSVAGVVRENLPSITGPNAQMATVSRVVLAQADAQLRVVVADGGHPGEAAQGEADIYAIIATPAS